MLTPCLLSSPLPLALGIQFLLPGLPQSQHCGSSPTEDWHKPCKHLSPDSHILWGLGPGGGVSLSWRTSTHLVKTECPDHTALNGWVRADYLGGSSMSPLTEHKTCGSCAPTPEHNLNLPISISSGLAFTLGYRPGRVHAVPTKTSTTPKWLLPWGQGKITTQPKQWDGGGQLV